MVRSVKHKRYADAWLLLISTYLCIIISDVAIYTYTNSSKAVAGPASEVIRLREYGNDVYPFINPEAYLTIPEFNPKPLSPPSNTRIIMANEGSGYPAHTTDRYGFNNEDSKWNYSKYDFIMLGDSFTHGCCQLNQNTISGHLQDLNLKFLNLGMGGTGTLAQLAIYLEYAARLKSDNIFLLLYENDLHDNADEMKNNIMKQYLSGRTQGLTSKTDSINRMTIDYLNENINSFNSNYEYNLAETIRGKNIKRWIKSISECDRHISDDQIEYTSTILSSLNTHTKNNGSKLTIFLLPSYNTVQTGKTPFLSAAKYLKKKLDYDGINYIDLTEKIDTSNFIHRSSHYNSSGYKIVAEEILNYISNKEPSNDNKNI